MTTGQGCSIMIRSRQARPSIRGMWMSSVITSGAKSASIDSASTPSRAWRISKSGCPLNMATRSLRISAESSTMRSLITARAEPSRGAIHLRVCIPDRRFGQVQTVQHALFRARQQFRRVEQQDHPGAVVRGDHAIDQPRDRFGRPVRRSGAGSIEAAATRKTSETLSTIKPARWRSARTTIRRWLVPSKAGMPKRRR